MLIPFKTLIEKFKINPKGVCHIGANNGAECVDYYSNGVERTLWVEAIPEVFKELEQVISEYPNAIAFNKCVSNVDHKKVTFNISSNHGESSSMLEFGTHATHHPDVTFVDKITLTTTRMDSLLFSKKIDIRAYDFLNIDLQGSELLALEGMGDMLRVFKYLYIEVNRAELYKGCAQFEDVVNYLYDYGFELKDIRWTGAGWGDAFFIKKQNMGSVFSRNARQFRSNAGMVNVPDRFLPFIKFPYPPDNAEIFERWYLNNFNEPTQRLYLPVQWTAYHVNNNFGNDTQAVKELQSYVDQLDRKKTYYTIHQFDLGCLVDFKDLDILVFGMAGGRIDYPLPLLCQPHKYEYDNPKTILASFIGRHTHPIREKMFKILRQQEGCYISDAKHDMSAYCSILSSSIFALCPRGFSGTSFRVLEALQYGSVPIIITDDLIEPHHVPAHEYAIVIGEDQLTEDLPSLLRGILESDGLKEKISKLKYYFDNFFLYNANKKLILEKVKETK